MNIRKSADYSAMFAALDTLMTADLPQMELYYEIGRLISGRQEKGAAVVASEYLCGAYPDASGFSPRNLRRMRKFYCVYENTPEVLAQTMTIGWTQNVVILEAELIPQERVWYIQAAKHFGWSKLELNKMIKESAHETTTLDSTADSCYSNGSGCDEDGTKKTSVTFLQDLRDTEVRQEFRWQRLCGPQLQSLFLPLTSAACRADDAPPPGKPPVAPPDQEQDDMAEKNQTYDQRPEGKALSRMVYAERFPHLLRNQKKQELSIRTLELSINGEICAPYGDLVYVKESYQVSRAPSIFVCTQQDGIYWTIKPPPKILTKLLKWTVHTLEIFSWGEDYCDSADFELENTGSPQWSVHVEYSNDEIRDVKSTVDFPDNVLELLFVLTEFYNDTESLLRYNGDRQGLTTRERKSII